MEIVFEDTNDNSCQSRDWTTYHTPPYILYLHRHYWYTSFALFLKRNPLVTYQMVHKGSLRKDIGQWE